MGLSFRPCWIEHNDSIVTMRIVAPSELKSMCRAGLKGNVQFKVRPHVPGVRWQTTNAPVCIFDADGEEALQKAWKNHTHSMKLGTMDCSATFAYGKNTAKMDSTQFTVSPYGDLLIQPAALLKLSESFDHHAIDAVTKTSRGKDQDNPYECAPRSRGGSYQFVVSTEQAFYGYHLLGMTLQLPRSFWCFFGYPFLEKFMMYDLWLSDERAASGYHWKCFELKIVIYYDPLFSYEESSIRQNDVTSSVIIDETKDIGFAFLFRSEMGMVPRFSVGVFLVALMTLGWLLSLPRLICGFYATHFGQLRLVYDAALSRPFHPASQIVAWAVRSMASAEALRKFSCGGKEVQIGKLLEELKGCLRI
ncbi:unnamed protein product [Durusdinium trenchii]|uniref:Uncharacterized protein n=1 Tax=Durusdinium trenchii TaxID=1381693 RepID=A0ABP0Q8R8_9DINO